MDRRDILKLGACTAAGLAVSSCGNEYMNNPAELQLGQHQETALAKFDGTVYKWQLALLVPSKFEIWGPGVQRFAETARVLSAGALDIRVRGAGEIVPPMQIFDAVKDGDVEMGHAASYFWDGKDPRLRAAVYFTSVPFGMTARGTASWLSAAGGQELWDELYSPFNLKALPLGNTGVQAGGWFRKPITSLKDLQGIKMRMPGLGGKVLTRAGGIAQTLPGHEIYIALERGRIDATEWIGPYHDYMRGFHEVAPYYYTGGWHEPGSTLELLINKEKWESLPTHLQRIIEVASVEADRWMYLQWAAKDSEYLAIIKADPKIHVADYPVEIARALRPVSEELKQEIRASSPIAQRIHDSYTDYQKLYEDYENASEMTYIRGRDS